VVAFIESIIFFFFFGWLTCSLHCRSFSTSVKVNLNLLRRMFPFEPKWLDPAIWTRSLGEINKASKDLSLLLESELSLRILSEPSEGTDPLPSTRLSLLSMYPSPSFVSSFFVLSFFLFIFHYIFFYYYFFYFFFFFVCFERIFGLVILLLCFYGSQTIVTIFSARRNIPFLV